MLLPACLWGLGTDVATDATGADMTTGATGADMTTGTTGAETVSGGAVVVGGADDTAIGYNGEV